MKKFEYEYKIIMNIGHKTYVEKNHIMLNEMGREGWELVSMCPASHGVATFACIFKRELEEDYDLRKQNQTP